MHLLQGLEKAEKFLMGELYSHAVKFASLGGVAHAEFEQCDRFLQVRLVRVGKRQALRPIDFHELQRNGE